MQPNSPAMGHDDDLYVPGDEPLHAMRGEQSRLSFEFFKAILWRQRVIIVSVILLALAAGFAWTLLTKPIYQATSSVRIDPYDSQILEGQELIDPYISSSEIGEYMNTLTAVIESRSLAIRVVESLELHKSEALLGESVSQELADGEGSEARTEQLKLRAANMLLGRVTASIPPQTRIIDISVRMENPELAARIANSYAQNFMMDDVNRGLEQSAFVRSYLEDQIEQTSEMLRQAERTANDYARANRLVGQMMVDDETGSGTLTASSLANINNDYVEARASRIAAEQRWRAVANIPASQLPEVQANSYIQRMKEERARLVSELADLRGRYQDDYPSVGQAQAQLDSLNERISSAEDEVKASIRDAFDVARLQEVGLEREVGRVSEATLDEQDRRVQFNLLQREVIAAQTQLQTLLDRYNQITAATSIGTSNATRLDDAIVPRAPVAPDMSKNLLIALILGISLAAGLAILRELFDDRLRSIDEVERKLGVAPLGQVPDAGKEPVVEAMQNAFTPVGEAYASIRATLDFLLSNKSWKVVQVTSSQASEGKTVTSVSLGTKYASIGKKVLIVDFDLRRPALARALGYASPDKGVVEVLYSHARLEDAVINTDQENLAILPVGQIPNDPIEVLSSGLVAEFLTKARTHFDVVILDSSPVLGIADAPLLSRFADTVVFVVEANSARSNQIRTAIRRMWNVGANIAGVVLTKYRALEAGQGYGSQYQYYYYTNKD